MYHRMDPPCAYDKEATILVVRQPCVEHAVIADESKAPHTSNPTTSLPSAQSASRDKKLIYV